MQAPLKEQIPTEPIVKTIWVPIPTENLVKDSENNFVFPFIGDVYYGIVVAKDGDYADILVEGIYENPDLLKGPCYVDPEDSTIFSVGDDYPPEENESFYVGWCYENGKLLLGAKPAIYLQELNFDQHGFDENDPEYPDR